MSLFPSVLNIDSWSLDASERGWEATEVALIWMFHLLEDCFYIFILKENSKINIKLKRPCLTSMLLSEGIEGFFSLEGIFSGLRRGLAAGADLEF